MSGGDFLEELSKIREEVVRASRSPWKVATVVSSDSTGHSATIRLANGTVVEGVSVVGNRIPDAGVVVAVAMHGSAPAVHPMPGDATWAIGTSDRSDDYVAGVSGWAIFADGSAEFNNVTVRGTMQASVLRANTLEGIATDLVVNGTAETAAPGTNLIQNPDFEVGVANWSVDTVSGGPATIDQIGTPVHGGSFALRMTKNTSTGAAWVRTPTGVNGMSGWYGEQVALSFWARAATTGRAVSAWLFCYDSAGVELGSAISVVVAPTSDVSGSYTQFTASFAISNDVTKIFTAYVSLAIVWGSVPSGEIHYLDDVSLSKSVIAWGIGGPGAVTSPAAISRDTVTKRSGAASFKLVTSASASASVTALVSQPYQVVGDGAYVWTGYASSLAGRPRVAFMADFWEQDGTYISGSAVAQFQDFSPGAWVPFSYAFNAPPEARFMSLFAYVPTDSATIYFDDMMLQRVTSVVGGWVGADTVRSKTDVMDATGLVMPVGCVLPFAGSTVFGVGAYLGGAGGDENPATTVWDAPNGWCHCDGRALSRTTFWRLFSVIGTAWGAGDGSTTFNVPDMRGRVPLGLDNIGGTDAGRLAVANTLGGTGTFAGAGSSIPYALCNYIVKL